MNSRFHQLRPSSVHIIIASHARCHLRFSSPPPPITSFCIIKFSILLCCRTFIHRRLPNNVETLLHFILPQTRNEAKSHFRGLSYKPLIHLKHSMPAIPSSPVFVLVMLWLVSTHLRRHAVRAFSTITTRNIILQQQQQHRVWMSSSASKATVYDEDLDTALDQILGDAQEAHIKGSKPMRTDLVATEDVSWKQEDMNESYL